MFDIVCYLGGTCGDLVVAMLDSKDCNLNHDAVVCNPERQRLKKSWQFATDLERNQYLSTIQQHYRSIPSHDTEYHLRNSHQFIAVVVQQMTTALWASQRFRKLHSDKVWQQMVEVNQANTVEKYAQDILDWSSWIQSRCERVIALEDILGGRAESRLYSIINNTTIDNDFYHQWLKAQNETGNYTCPG